MEQEFIQGTLEYMTNPIVLIIIVVGIIYQIVNAIRNWWHRKNFLKDWMKAHNIGKKYWW